MNRGTWLFRVSCASSSDLGDPDGVRRKRSGRHIELHRLGEGNELPMSGMRPSAQACGQQLAPRHATWLATATWWGRRTCMRSPLEKKRRFPYRKWSGIKGPAAVPCVCSIVVIALTQAMAQVIRRSSRHVAGRKNGINHRKRLGLERNRPHLFHAVISSFA